MGRVSDGSATTMRPSTESASGLPSRSRMSPRAGGQLDGDGAALGRRQGGVLLRAHALELHQPGAEERQHHGDEHEAGAEPQLGRSTHGAAATPGGARRGGGCAGPAYGRTGRDRGGSWWPSLCFLLEVSGCRSGWRAWPRGGRRCFVVLVEAVRWWCVAGGWTTVTWAGGFSSAGLAGGGASSRSGSRRVAGVGLPRTRPVLQVEHGGAGGQHHPHPLGLERDHLRVAQLVELHLQGLLTGEQGVGLVLQRGRGERRLLHRGVEEEQARRCRRPRPSRPRAGTAPGCSGGASASGRR